MEGMVAGASCGYNAAAHFTTFSSRLHASILPAPSLLLKRQHPLPSLRARASHSSPATQEQTMQSTLKVAKSLESIKVLDLEGKSVSVADLWKDRKAVVAFTRHFGCVLCMKRADLLASRKDELDAASVSLIIVGPGKVDQAKAFAKSTNFPGEIYADPDFATHKALEFVSGVGSTVSLTTGLRVISAYLEGYRQDWELSFDEDTVSKGGCEPHSTELDAEVKISSHDSIIRFIWPLVALQELAIRPHIFLSLKTANVMGHMAWNHGLAEPFRTILSCKDRQQGGVLVAGPGKENILYLFKDAKAGDEPNMDDIVAACRNA